MDFSNTQTYLNLARAFAGECQAGMRYQLIAKEATSAGLMALADTLRTIAKNETNHARVFFEALIAHAGSTDNIPVEAGYPFHTGTIAESLLFAAEDEKSEHEHIYPGFARTAREEGFEDIARSFGEVAKVEKNHEVIFRYLHEAVKGGTLYASEHPVIWICGECGYMHTSKEAWKVCPLCGAKQGEVLLHLPYEGI